MINMDDNWKKKKIKVKKIKPVKLKMSKLPKVKQWEKMPIADYMKKRGKKKQTPFGF